MLDSSSWIIAEIPIADALGEAVAEALRAAGADGVAEEWRKEQHFVRGFWKGATEEEAGAEVRQALNRLVDAGLLGEVPTLTLSSMEDQDWLEGWKQYFSPLEISPRLAVCPSWETYSPRPGQQVITLDPGMAFGTGTHGTTFTCMQALSAFLQPGMSVCDVGCGSGVLSIAAVKLGAGRVVATDNDKLAIHVAQENARINHVEDDIAFQITDLLAGIEGPFDLVIANILAPVILELIPSLPRVLGATAYFISSGYILEQEDDIRNALLQHGHAVIARYEQERWVTLVSHM